MSVQNLKMLAREHWNKWLPEKVSRLKAEGSLDQELLAAANLAQEEIETLMKKGYSVDEAKEVALPRFILLPPENEESDLSPEQIRELEEKSAEYHRNPPLM